MASVDLPAQRFRDGAFPAVCSRTGRPTEDRATLVADRRPAWLAVVVPTLLGTTWLSDVAEGTVPMRRAVVRRQALVRRLWPAVIGVGLTVTVLGVAEGTSTGAALGALLVAAGFATPLALDRLTVRGRLSKDGGCVRLVHVHPDFAAAAAPPHHDRLPPVVRRP